VDIKTGGWASSTQAWIDFVDGTDPNRDFVIDAAMLDKLKNVSGTRVLDEGCGEGRICRQLARGGAETIGLDPTPEMIEQAIARHESGQYIEGYAENMPFLDNSFDTVVSYVSLCDMPDYRSAITEMARVLKPKGALLVAIHNAFCTTSPTGWLKNQQGEKQIFPVDNYTFEWGSKVAWKGIEVVNYHRPMSDYMKAFLSQQLTLKSYEEPLPSAQDVRDHPNVKDYLRVPVFVVMEWQKE